ncbi:MAG: DUF1007 family protein [Spirochaetia bacterium]|jgi:ABC-type uncharacterized transport system substrate-binding protein
MADGGMLQGVSFTWTFDEMFSNMILSDYDPKYTGQFDAAQAKALKQGAFDNLENYLHCHQHREKTNQSFHDRAICAQRA